MASIFVTHGGGPYPILQKQTHAQMSKQLQSIQKRFPNPRGVIVFSAHWQQSSWTILDHDNPELYYDYYGFPPQSYNLSYSMRSSETLRKQVKEHLLKNGVTLETNTKRGYDHGVFIPLMMIYPQGQVPVIQISILNNLNPQAHFRMGQTLQQLKKRGFLILGSGSSVHGGFFQTQSTKISQLFDNQLSHHIKSAKNEEDLLKVCLNWRKLPGSKQMHPREEHLVPLFVNLGGHSGDGRQQMHLELYNLHLSNYVFE